MSFYAAPTPSGAADCSTPSDACSIIDAVTAANGASVSDQVDLLLDKGVYQLATANPTALVVTFAGPGLTIEGRNGTPTLNGTNTQRIMSIDAASTVAIDGIEFEHGQSTGPGGAIQNGGTLSIENSNFASNTAANGGAIASNAGSTLMVSDTSFLQNATTGIGGGAVISYSTTTIERSAIFNSTAPINGGGLNVQPGGSLTLANSTVANNVSGSLGGGISNLGDLKVYGSTVINNRGSDGSAIATGSPNVTLAASLLTSSSPNGSCNGATPTDAGYNIDDDGTCISPTMPGTGSHAGTTAYGSSTYGEVLDSYLADVAAFNGGQSRTFALLNSPDPATDLANPALAVVPTDYDFPTPVSGESNACSLADQRGVLPAAGIACDMGAYLLQQTEIELTASASSVEQNQPVTYTATITPAPDGGTVSFDDGAGNPATVNCPAEYLANGAATCTVSYPDPGTYPVTASYTGDGDRNNFTASQSVVPTNVTTEVTPTPPPVVDRPLRLLGAIKFPKNGYNKIRVKIPAAGQVELIGYKRVKGSSAHFDQAGTYLIKAVPKGPLLRKLNRRGSGRALVKIKYTPDEGRMIAKSVVYPFVKKIQVSRRT
ncbi:MAG: Ig-like domain repeat protein [Solirubrobacterales bacterium]|nr:Ig-like domain repeat protein [Solirubrobacterales bacterium]